MRIGRLLKLALLSPLLTVFLLFVLGLLYAGFRLLTYEQIDNREHLGHKQAYLRELAQLPPGSREKPNIIFILYDDMGFGDIGFSSSELIDTPNIDRLAQNGLVFSSFYSPAPVCTPSRAGFLTGRTPARAGMPHVVFPTGSVIGSLNRIISPTANVRLPEEEITLAEIMQAVGYRTGMVGKWHLGDRSPSLPVDFGFNYFFGALYSNDMQPFELYRNREIAVAEPVDQRFLSETYSREVVSFIEENTGQPFFLYHAHNFPHDPLHSRDERLGKSDGGLYGDVLEELDEGVGAIIKALEKSGRLENTLIIISSDNGPWFLGSAGAQRGRKGSTFEGGMHVPFIVHWPQFIPQAKTVSAMASGIDLLPTVLDILDLPAPDDRELDGRSLLGILSGDQTDSPHEYLYYHDGNKLFATRNQHFKYRAALPVAYGTDEFGLQLPTPQKEWLFDLANDPLESYDVSERHLDIAKRLRGAHLAREQVMQGNPRGWR